MNLRLFFASVLCLAALAVFLCSGRAAAPTPADSAAGAALLARAWDRVHVPGR